MDFIVTVVWYVNTSFRFVPVNAAQLLLLLLGISVIGTLFNPDDGIAHSSHLGGLLTGIAYFYLFKRF